jgi:hypothetical protein
MMGARLEMQESLFYEFRFEDHVPADHLLRRIDPLWTCQSCAGTLPGSTARLGGRRLIRN